MIINFTLKILATFGLILLSPLIAISLLLILIEDGLPVLFIQNRLGLNKKVFRIYKIRTMYKETPNLGTHDVSSSQYLKVGKILRKLKIDELPQIFNFIKGDINLIGPRPNLPNQGELIKYRDKDCVFSIIPGISGLAQVLGFDMSNPRLLSNIDALYIRKKSYKLDILIFIATFLKSYRKKLALKFKNEILKYTEEQNDKFF